MPVPKQKPLKRELRILVYNWPEKEKRLGNTLELDGPGKKQSGWHWNYRDKVDMLVAEGYIVRKLDKLGHPVLARSPAYTGGTSDWQRTTYIRTNKTITAPRKSAPKQNRQLRYAAKNPLPCSVQDHFEYMHNNPLHVYDEITRQLTDDDTHNDNGWWGASYDPLRQFRTESLSKTELKRWREVLLRIFKNSAASADWTGVWVDSKLASYCMTGEGTNVVLAILMLKPVFDANNVFVRFNLLTAAEATATLEEVLHYSPLERYLRYKERTLEATK